MRCTAVDAGADAVYCGFQDATNARNFPRAELYARRDWPKRSPMPMRAAQGAAGAEHLSAGGQGAICGVRPPTSVRGWGLTPLSSPTWAWPTHIACTHPQMRLHLSVQAAASSPRRSAIIARISASSAWSCPRILTIPEIRADPQEIPCEIETFIFGNHGLMVEGAAA